MSARVASPHQLSARWAGWCSSLSVMTRPSGCDQTSRTELDTHVLDGSTVPHSTPISRSGRREMPGLSPQTRTVVSPRLGMVREFRISRGACICMLLGRPIVVAASGVGVRVSSRRTKQYGHGVPKFKGLISLEEL